MCLFDCFFLKSKNIYISEVKVVNFMVKKMTKSTLYMNKSLYL